MTLAGCLQGAIGFGMGLIAAPILVLIDVRFVPGPLIASSLLLCVLIALRDRAHIDFETVRFSMLGNAAGAFAGASVLVMLDARGFAVAFGLIVLVGVSLSAAGLRVAVNRGTALGAGALGGFMSATASIGGPPMALVYQHESADRFRGTLGVYFVASNCVSLVALAWVGRFGSEEFGLSLVLFPAQMLGFALSFRAKRLLQGISIRPFILGLSGLAGATVLGRVVIG